MKHLLASFFMLFAGAWLTTAAHAYPVNQCAANRLGSDLGCNANDVSITGMAVVSDATSCIGGAPVTLDLEMTINFQNPDRYAIGIFISNDGKDPQFLVANGGAATCSVSVLPNSSPFQNLDGPPTTPDTCGDGGSLLSGIHYMSNVTVPCQSLAGAGGNLFIPFVVSWDQNKAKTTSFCSSNADAVPGGTSKCNSPNPLTPEGIAQGSVAIIVLPKITNTDNITTLFSGGTTNYIVTIINTTGAILSGAVFKDPAVTGITANSVTCSTSGGASCPASTVAAMQGAGGITIPDMPVNGSVTFTINATLTGSPGNTRTNTATVTVGSQINSASDTDTIVDTIAILPTPQSKTGAKGGTVTYTYTLYNFGPTTDTVTLAAVSSKVWTLALSPASVAVPAGGSTTVTLVVTIPSSALIGDVDSTTITATSGVNPAKKATATAVTTVTTILTLVPSNTGAGGAGSSAYYSHRVQNNDFTSKSVSLTPVLSGTCTGWTSALLANDKITSLTSPVTLAANGGFRDFVLKISIPVGAATASTCTATLTAQYTSGTANAVSVTDVTTVKNLLLYKDPSYTTESYVYPAGNNVYAKGFGLDSAKSYEYRWYNSLDVEVCTPRATSTTGTIFPNTCTIPVAGPLGTWSVQIWNVTNNTSFSQTNFYVGPDHLKASYSGANPAINTNAVINLVLHDKLNHVVPKDPAGNLVKGSPTDPEGPLMITVTVSGSGQIISTTLTNATISGQSVTGKLDSTTGTATLTISDSVAESVTITPVSYKGVLHGSPLRNEPVTITFTASIPVVNHYELSLPTSSITCMPTTAIVTACADNITPCTKSTIVSGQTATLAASNGTLAVSPLTFNASGVASTTLSYPLAANGATASVTLSGESMAASNPRQCCPDGVNCVVANSCSTTFNSAGFIFSLTAGGGIATIPTQVAGTSSAPYYLRAIKTSSTTKACEAALVGASAINFAYECNDPTTCYAANLMSINGGTATTIARNNNGSVSSYTSVNMTFDVDGNAPFTFNYGDVGKVTLHTNKTLANSAVLAGSSNPFVVKPYDFGIIPCAASVVGACITAPTDPGLVGGGGVFAKAGQVFKATVTARTFSGVATPSFGLGTNNGTETVVLTHTRVAPTGGLTVPGSLSGTTSMFRSIFSNGIATISDLSWNEVGVITLTATNNAFLGNALTTSGTTGNLGRFAPHHFIIAVTNTGSFDNSISTNTTFTYLGEIFSYTGDKPQFTIYPKALGADDGDPNDRIYNYTSGFNKIDLGEITLTYPTADNTQLDQTKTAGVYITLTSTAGTHTLTDVGDGTIILTLSGGATSDKFSYGRGLGRVAPFTPALTISLANITETNDSVSSTNGPLSVTPSGLSAEQRFGRAVLQNSFGPETQDQAMPLILEFYAIDPTDPLAFDFFSNNLDLNTTFASQLPAGPSDLICSDPAPLPAPPGDTLECVEVGGTNNNVHHKDTFPLTNPGLGNTGVLNYTLDLLAKYPWLQYDWDDVDGLGNGPYDDNPSATATFGIYRGNDRIINWREIVR